jgi:VanZ family protein
MAAIFYVSSENTWTVFSGPPWVQALRKSAHVVEYSVLALLLGRALVITWQLQGKALTQRILARIWQLGVAISALYACSDEIHQAFVPRREFHLTDVLIDALSATAALGVWYIIRPREALPYTSRLEQM